MPTDPFVSTDRATEPRNEPNLAPGITMPPARDWRADRPGDLVDGAQPRGALFGSPGPNVGYAVLLVHRTSGDFALAAHEHLEDSEAVVGALAMKRAASFGRGPVGADVECGALVLGYRGEASPELVDWRADAVEGAHHEYEIRQRICDAVPVEVLRLAPSALAPRAAEVHAALPGAFARTV